MTFAEAFVRAARRILPSPFTIAVLLTFFTAFLAWILTETKAENAATPYFLQIAEFWKKGLWELLAFAMQMMLILVLGYVLAISRPVNNFINHTAFRFCKDTPSAAYFITLLTMFVALINWGLGLIFGAVFARKVGEYALRNNISLNYPLIGAAGYSGLMVWHGGLSGSAPLKITEAGHFLESKIGIVSTSETIFSTMNIVVSIALLLIVPAIMYWLGKRSEEKSNLEDSIVLSDVEGLETSIPEFEGAERLDHSRIFAAFFGLFMLVFGLYKALKTWDTGGTVLTLNFIIYILFALGILFHGSFHQFTSAIGKSITSSAGIMIQFPLYAGIMGIMKYSGLIDVFSDFFVQISNQTTFPLFTFLSAGLVNVFVPSGGGQWVVQGPIIVEAAQQLGVAFPKCVMALAYGDQLTNMMQPFWALPLLGITGLKAKDILPYTLFLMLIGGCIFVLGLLIF